LTMQRYELSGYPAPSFAQNQQKTRASLTFVKKAYFQP